MPGTRYYYADDNSQPVGPLSLDEIRKFADAGVVRPDVMVCKEDGSVWKPLTSFVAPPRTAPPPRVTSIPDSIEGSRDPDRVASGLHVHLSHAIVAVILFYLVDISSRSAAIANAGTDPSSTRSIFAGLTALWATAAELILVFHICRAFPRRLRFATPAKAAWFMIIPGFNIYWAFRLLPSFAEATMQWDKEAPQTIGTRKPAPGWLLPIAYASATLVGLTTVIVLLELIAAIPLTEFTSIVCALDYGLRFAVYVNVASVVQGILSPDRVERHVSMELSDDGKTPKVLQWGCNVLLPTIFSIGMGIFMILKILQTLGVIDL